MEEKNDKIKKPVSIRIFGGIAVAWGMLIIYHFLSFLLQGQDYKGLLSWLDKVLSYRLFVGLLLIGSGFGLLRIKPWARQSILSVMPLVLMGLIMNATIFGFPLVKIADNLITLIGMASFIWFFNRNTIKSYFPYYKKLKFIILILSAAIFVLIVLFGRFWLKLEGYRIPKLAKVAYPFRDKSFYNGNYFYSPLPLEYTLAIPNSFTLFIISGNKNGIVNVFLANQQKELITITNGLPIQDVYKKLGFNDEYTFYKKLLQERFGLLYVALRRIIMPISIMQVDEIKVGSLDVFIEKGDKTNSFINQYVIFDKGKSIGGGMILGGDKGRESSSSQIDEIIASIRPQDKPLKSAQDFFQEGLSLFNNADFEKAKFSFAAVLCLDWDNAEYHYYLGKAFFETENWHSAKKHLEKATALQPNFSEAKVLLDEATAKDAEAKQRKKKESGQ